MQQQIPFEDDKQEMQEQQQMQGQVQRQLRQQVQRQLQQQVQERNAGILPVRLRSGQAVRMTTC
jgi:hypothetical protein